MEGMFLRNCLRCAHEGKQKTVRFKNRVARWGLSVEEIFYDHVSYLSMKGNVVILVDWLFPILHPCILFLWNL